MTARRKPVSASRVLGDFASVARTDPFRVAFALSVLLHLVLFAAVRIEPLRRWRDPGAPLITLRLIPEPPEQPSRPARQAPEAEREERPASPARVGRAAAADLPPAAVEGDPAALDVPRVPWTAAGETAETPPPGPSMAEAAPQPAPLAGERSREAGTPQPLAAPLVPAAPNPLPAVAGDGVPAPTEAGPAAGGEPGGGPTGGTVAAAAPASPAGLAGGVGSGGHAGDGEAATAPAGRQGAGGASGTGSTSAASPGPGDLAAVRRRIDARKVYPQIAVRNGWEGRVLVEMRLEGDGSLAGVRLLQGSGYAVLDEATITAVRSASPFPPVARMLTVPVEYRLIP